VARTQLVPTVGWPANGTSRAGVKMRTRHAVRPRGGQHERRLGQVHLTSHRLHLAVGGAAGVEHDGERVASEGAIGEDVDPHDAKDARHGGHYT